MTDTEFSPDDPQLIRTSVDEIRRLHAQKGEILSGKPWKGRIASSSPVHTGTKEKALADIAQKMKSAFEEIQSLIDAKKGKILASKGNAPHLIETADTMQKICKRHLPQTEQQKPGTTKADLAELERLNLIFHIQTLFPNDDIEQVTENFDSIFGDLSEPAPADLLEQVFKFLKEIPDDKRALVLKLGNIFFSQITNNSATLNERLAMLKRLYVEQMTLEFANLFSNLPKPVPQNLPEQVLKAYKDIHPLKRVQMLKIGSLFLNQMAKGKKPLLNERMELLKILYNIDKTVRGKKLDDFSRLAQHVINRREPPLLPSAVLNLLIFLTKVPEERRKGFVVELQKTFHLLEDTERTLEDPEVDISSDVATLMKMLQSLDKANFDHLVGFLPVATQLIIGIKSLHATDLKNLYDLACAGMTVTPELINKLAEVKTEHLSEVLKLMVHYQRELKRLSPSEQVEIVKALRQIPDKDRPIFMHLAIPLVQNERGVGYSRMLKVLKNFVLESPDIVEEAVPFLHTFRNSDNLTEAIDILQSVPSDHIPDLLRRIKPFVGTVKEEDIPGHLNALLQPADKIDKYLAAHPILKHIPDEKLKEEIINSLERAPLHDRPSIIRLVGALAKAYQDSETPYSPKDLSGFVSRLVALPIPNKREVIEFARDEMATDYLREYASEIVDFLSHFSEEKWKEIVKSHGLLEALINLDDDFGRDPIYLTLSLVPLIPMEDRFILFGRLISALKITQVESKDSEKTIGPLLKDFEEVLGASKLVQQVVKEAIALARATKRADGATFQTSLGRIKGKYSPENQALDAILTKIDANGKLEPQDLDRVIALIIKGMTQSIPSLGGIGPLGPTQPLPLVIKRKIAALKDLKALFASDKNKTDMENIAKPILKYLTADDIEKEMLAAEKKDETAVKNEEQLKREAEAVKQAAQVKAEKYKRDILASLKQVSEHDLPAIVEFASFMAEQCNYSTDKLVAFVGRLTGLPILDKKPAIEFLKENFKSGDLDYSCEMIQILASFPPEKWTELLKPLKDLIGLQDDYGEDPIVLTARFLDMIPMEHRSKVLLKLVNKPELTKEGLKDSHKAIKGLFEHFADLIDKDVLIQKSVGDTIALARVARRADGGTLEASLGQIKGKTSEDNLSLNAIEDKVKNTKLTAHDIDKTIVLITKGMTQGVPSLTSLGIAGPSQPMPPILKQMLDRLLEFKALL